MKTIHSLDYYARRVRARIPIPAWQTMRGGYQMHLRPAADPYERRLYVVGDYEPATLALMDEVLRPGSTMVDVGANLGLMTLHGAKLVGPKGKVVAVEAHPVYFERLSRNIARNHFTNIEAVNLAAGSAPGQAKIFDMPSVNIGRASLIDPGEGGVEAGVTRIKTLDTILNGIKPDFIKIDVEGFEAPVITGGIKTLTANRPVICMEVNDDQPTPGQDHRAAHDILMGLGLWDAFRFKHSKFEGSAELVKIESRDELASFHDNVIYKPK